MRDPWTCRCGHEFAFIGIGTRNCREVPHECRLAVTVEPRVYRCRFCNGDGDFENDEGERERCPLCKGEGVS